LLFVAFLIASFLKNKTIKNHIDSAIAKI